MNITQSQVETILRLCRHDLYADDDCIRGNAAREIEMIMEELVEAQKPIPPVVVEAGIWADEKPEPITVNITNSGVNRNPLDKAADSIKALGDAFKNTSGLIVGSAGVQLQRPEKHPFSTLEHPADRHQLHSKNPHLRVEELNKQHRICIDSLSAAEADIIETIQSGRVPPESSYSRVGRLHEAMQSIEAELTRITKS